MHHSVRKPEHLSIEDKVVLLCARLSQTPEQRSELGKLLQHGGLSWEEVLSQARWHRLLGHLYLYLHEEEFADAVPEWVMDTLKKTYFRNGLKNRLFQMELNKVLSALGEADIPVIALKGSALLDRVYRNPSVRPMADIDLLVPEERASLAQATVMRLGYAPAANLEEQEKTVANHRHLPKLVDAQGQIKFEIHTHIVSRDSPLRFDLFNFWRQAQDATVAGREIQILAPQHLLIHLCLHFFLDRRFRSAQAIGQLCDISEVARYYADSIDWAALAEEVLHDGLGGPVHCSLSLARELLGAPVPSEFLDRIRPPEFDAASVQLFLSRRVLDNKRVIASQWVGTGREYNLQNVIRGMLSRLFPSKSYLSKDYGEEAERPGITRAHFERLGHGWAILRQYLFNPLDVWREIQVDRWIHFVSSNPQSSARGTDNQRLEPQKYGQTPNYHQEIKSK